MTSGSNKSTPLRMRRSSSSNDDSRNKNNIQNILDISNVRRRNSRSTPTDKKSGRDDTVHGGTVVGRQEMDGENNNTAPTPTAALPPPVSMLKTVEKMDRSLQSLCQSHRSWSNNSNSSSGRVALPPTKGTTTIDANGMPAAAAPSTATAAAEIPASAAITLSRVDKVKDVTTTTTTRQRRLLLPTSPPINAPERGGELGHSSNYNNDCGSSTSPFALLSLEMNPPPIRNKTTHSDTQTDDDGLDLEIEEDADESLLFSPMPKLFLAKATLLSPAAADSRSVCSPETEPPPTALRLPSPILATTTINPPPRTQSSSGDAVGASSTAAASRGLRPTRLSGPPQRVAARSPPAPRAAAPPCTITAPDGSTVATESSPFQQQQQHPPLPRVDYPVTTTTTATVNQDSETSVTTSKASGCVVAPPAAAASSRKQWSATTLSVIRPHAAPFTTTTTPFTVTKRQAIRMDLSDIFFNAAKQHTATAKKQPPLLSSSIKSTLKKSGQTPAVKSHSRPDNLNDNNSSSHNNKNDEWAEKQVQTFTSWLNYLFYPTEDTSRVERSSHDGGTAESAIVARTALRSLVSHQRLAQGRLAATNLYQHDPELVRLKKIVAAEIARGRIALRTDRDLYANLSHRDKITSLLLSYSTPWLRLGLETIFGTVIQPETPSFVSPRPAHRAGGTIHTKAQQPLSHLKWVLKQFIVRHVLSDDVILAKYTGGKCKVPSGKFEARYRKELHPVVLNRLLTLIVFLDRAKVANVLDQAPNLFTHASVVKSTRDVLLAFCRDFLKAEGDFVKHLTRVGLQVFYKQEAVNELDYTVTNLRVDLNDGVRLARMTELLTGASLMSKLRLPAVSRLQKFHNVGLALNQLSTCRVSIDDVAPHHIVDGHREMVLKLLWSVVSGCCLQDLLTLETVQEEIGRIQKLYALPRSPIPLEETPTLDRLLLSWCDLVCSRFGRSVLDFIQSFADGKVVCLLIHFYHPTLLRLEDIHLTTNDALAKCNNRDSLLANERSNGVLANARMSDLGGIPGMIPVCDTSNPPEQKSMQLCLTFLCSRLIESSLEVRACVMIQNCYRCHQNRILTARKKLAATKIFIAWKMNQTTFYLRQKHHYGAAVRTIEMFLKAHQYALPLMRRRRLDWERYIQSVVTAQVRPILRWDKLLCANPSFSQLPQKHIRSFCAKKRTLCLYRETKSVVVLQSLFRKVLAHRNFMTLLIYHQAARSVQHCWAQYKAVKSIRHSAAIQIQRFIRGYMRRFNFAIDKMDIIVVQSCVRKWSATQRLLRLVTAAIKIQCAVRYSISRSRMAEMQRFAVHVRAACTLQNYYRRRLSLKTLICNGTQRAATILIQTHWRRQQARILFAKIIVENTDRLYAIAMVQRSIRPWLARLRLRERQQHKLLCIDSSTIVQQSWRRYITIVKFQLIRKDLVMIQTSCRRFIAKRAAHRRGRSISRIQDAARIFLVRNRLKKLVMFSTLRETFETNAAVQIQTLFRCWFAQVNFIEVGKRILTIQRFFRGHVARINCYLLLSDITICQSIARQWLAFHSVRRRNDAVLTLQCAIRCYRSRRDLNSRWHAQRRQLMQLHATSTLQRCLRGCFGRRLARAEESARMIQKTWRCYTVHVEYMLSILAAIELQSVFRRHIALNRCKQMLSAVVCVQSFSRLAIYRLRIMRKEANVVKIQSQIRMHFCRGEFSRHQKRVRSSIRIQAIVRTHAVRSSYLVAKTAIAFIQRCARGCVVRLQLETDNFAASEIQRIWKGFVAREYLAWNILAAIQIQSYARMLLAQKLAVRKIVERSAAHRLRLLSTKRIQRAYRNFIFQRSLYSSACVLQRIMRQFLSRIAFKVLQQNAIQIQTFYRGRLVRTSLSKEILFYTTRIQKANAVAKAKPELKLGNRTKAALEELVKSRTLTEIMEAIRILEEATRLSEVCCNTFVNTGAPGILFSLIRSCNRSLPHIKVLHGVLKTLTNVARFDFLIPSMATARGVDVFLDLIQMFRDKEHVFGLVVSLLEKVVHANQEVMVSQWMTVKTYRFSHFSFPSLFVQVICNSRENLKRLKAMHSLCKRKLSVAGPDYARRSCSLEFSSPIVSTRRGVKSTTPMQHHHDVHDFRKVIQRLERIILFVEWERQ